MNRNILPIKNSLYLFLTFVLMVGISGCSGIKIVADYEGEFLPVKEDAPCKFCGYKFYCPKWG